jgi:hypothetical protein
VGKKKSDEGGDVGAGAGEEDVKDREDDEEQRQLVEDAGAEIEGEKKVKIDPKDEPKSNQERRTAKKAKKEKKAKKDKKEKKKWVRGGVAKNAAKPAPKKVRITELSPPVRNTQFNSLVFPKIDSYIGDPGKFMLFEYEFRSTKLPTA